MAQPIFGPFTRPLSATFSVSAPPPALDSNFLSGGVAAPFFIGVNLGQSVGTNTKSIRADGPFEVMVVAVAYDYTNGHAIQVSSITESSSTLTFTQRFSYNVAVQTPGSPPTAGGNLCIEVWVAPMVARFNPSQAAITYTLTMTGNSTDNVEATCFWLKNLKPSHVVNNNFFDPNFPLENDAESVSGTAGTALPQPVPKTGVWTTGRPGDLLLAYNVCTGNHSPTTVTPAGWTTIVNSFAGAIRFLGYGIDMLGVAKKGTIGSYQNGSSSTEAGWITVVDPISF